MKRMIPKISIFALTFLLFLLIISCGGSKTYDTVFTCGNLEESHIVDIDTSEATQQQTSFHTESPVETKTEVPTSAVTYADTDTASENTSAEEPVETQPETSAEIVTSEETNISDVILTPGKTEMSAEDIPLRNALMDYYLAMFKDIAKDGSENVLYSPLSVFSATAMVTEGAKGDTLAQLESLLGISRSDLPKAYGLSVGNQGEFSQLLSANSLWIDTHEAMTVGDATIEKIQSAYGAGVFNLDLQAPETLGQLNGWVSDHTKGRIPKMLDEINEDSRLMLVNALSFDAEWGVPYSEYQQKDGSFKNADGTVSQVTMLTGAEDFYIEDKNAAGFYKLYRRSEDGKRYAFAAILPKEGMTPAEYLATLDGEGLRNLLYNYANDVILLTKLPAFKAETSYELSKTYQNLGCKIPFTPSADFSDLAVSENSIYIDSIIHKAFIEVDALGTKAGASTIIGMPEGEAPGTEIIKEIYLDRPFIYMIMDTETGLPVFMGITSTMPNE